MFEAVSQENERRTGLAGMVVSFLFHTGLILLIILGYAFTKQIIEPEPEPTVVTFFQAPPPPPPPPAGGKKAKKKPKEKKPKPQPQELVQPVEVPEEEPEETEVDDELDDLDGMEGGVVGGQVGGVVGGEIGGQVGGQLGGTGLVNLGYQEKALRFLEKKQPDYPKMAQRQSIEGTVVVEIIFGTDGEVEEARVVAGPKIFHEGVLETVRAWRIEPYTTGGVATRVQFRSRINFRLRAG